MEFSNIVANPTLDLTPFCRLLCLSPDTTVHRGTSELGAARGLWGLKPQGVAPSGFSQGPLSSICNASKGLQHLQGDAAAVE